MKPGKDFVGIFVCGICHDGQGEVLYMHRSQKARDEQGNWNIGAGGTLELGETLEACLVREVKEETDADIKDFEYIGHREIFREKDGIKSHWIGHYFKVLVEREKVKIMEDVFDDMTLAVISRYSYTDDFSLRSNLRTVQKTLLMEFVV